MKDPFDVFYSVGEIAKRLGFSDTTIREKLQAGEFGPEVKQIGQDIRVPYFAGIAPFLARHPYTYTEAAKEFNREVMKERLKPRDSKERGPFSAGVSARNVGELRRKLNAQEEQNGQS